MSDKPNKKKWIKKANSNSHVGSKHVKREKNEFHPSLTLPNATVEKYARGTIDFNPKNVKDKRLRRTLERTQEHIMEAAVASAATEVLLPAEPGYITSENNEKTYKFSQKEILKNVDMNTAKNRFDLQLHHFGPYRVNYTRNGRYMLFAGERGHLAIMDCLKMDTISEVQLQETVYDAHFLHNESLFATAQEKYVYIYDNKGTEIHCLRRHPRPYRVDYLPYHFLLTSVGHAGYIRWHDISVGECVAEYPSGHGPTRVLKHNPINAVSHLGHQNGVVTLWSPATNKCLVSMLCHRGPVSDVCINREGNYMATAGGDGLVKVWDLRNYKMLQSYKTEKPVTSLDYSEQGLLGISFGRKIQILRDVHIRPADMTYLNHSLTADTSLPQGGNITARSRCLSSNIYISNIAFRPLEDVLGIGYSHGVSSIIIPGSGEANYDSFENNPFMNPKQRREYEIHNLINKLKYDMIGIESSFIGRVDRNKTEYLKEKQERSQENSVVEVETKERDRKRGRNKIAAKLRRKQKNIVEAQTQKFKENLQKQEEEKLHSKRNESHQPQESEASIALRRFH